MVCFKSNYKLIKVIKMELNSILSYKQRKK